MSEEWRDVDGWPYEVSSWGNVRRSRAGGSPIAKAGRSLRPVIDKDGYLCVTLCDKPRMKTVKVHSLVCRAFNGEPPPDTDQVRHRDGCPTNNQPDNLCWGSALSNAADRELHGRQGRGETASRAVFTQAEVDLIRAEHAAAQVGRQRVPKGYMQATAERYGVPINTLSAVIRNGYN